MQEASNEAALEAEKVLEEAIELEPDAPDLQHNLALALFFQDRTDEYKQRLHTVVEHHPDYVFSRVTLAKHSLRDGDVEGADTLLRPILSRDQFHFKAFSVFADAYVE